MTIDIIANAKAYVRPSEQLITEHAERHGVSRASLLGPDRSPKISHVRQSLYAALYHEAKLTLPQIGQRFARDHSTILHGIRAHKARMEAGMPVNPVSLWEKLGVDDRIDEIKRMNAEGVARDKIARVLGVTYKTMANFLSQNGVYLERFEARTEPAFKVRQGWNVDRESEEHRNFIVAQDMKFQARMAEVGGSF